MPLFHRRTFELLGYVPSCSAHTESLLLQTEKRLDLKLPASVREWYACDDALEILAEHSNHDPPITFDKLEVIGYGSRSLLPFKYENQGVCVWAIQVGESNDPPVYVDVDSDGADWQCASPSFSEYVYHCVWDYRAVFGRGELVAAQSRALSIQTMASLNTDFTPQGISHGWPGHTQLRYAGDDHALLIWNALDQADWFLAADDELALERVLRKVWSLDDVGSKFYNCSPNSENVLNRVRDVK